jgi:hypothetical protein
MTLSTRLVTLALLTAAATTSFAATEPPSAGRVEVIVSRDLAAAEAVLALRSFDTAYEMSTGRRMTVASVGDGLRVRYGRRAPATLRHDGQGRFVSEDGHLALRFQLDADGDPQLVRFLMPVQWQ